MNLLHFLHSIPTGYVFAMFIGAYATFLAAVSMVLRARRLDHARVVSLPRVYGRRFQPAHAKRPEPVEDITAAVVMEVAA